MPFDDTRLPYIAARVVHRRQAGEHAVMLRVCTFNVHAWGDEQGRVRLDETIDVLARIDSDVIVLNEVLSPGGALTRVARALDMHVSFAPSAYGGNAVLTRQRDVPAHSAFLTATGGEPRSVVLVRIDSDFGPLVVAGTHLDHRREAVRVAQLAQLFDVLREWIGDDDELGHVIAGDLNAVRTADYPRDVLDAIVQRRVKNGHEPSLNDVVHALDQAGYVDAARLAHTKDLTNYRTELATDVPPPLPEALRSTCWAGTRIDHVWLDARLSAHVGSVHVEVIDTDVSDHFPVVAELQRKRDELRTPLSSQ